MLLPELSSVYMPCFRSVVPRLSFAKVQFHWFLGGGAKTNTRRGVALMIFFKHSPGNSDSKYIWLYRYNYLGSSVFEILFLALLALQTKRKRCGQVRLTPCNSNSQVMCAYQFFSCSSILFSGKILCSFF